MLPVCRFIAPLLAVALLAGCASSSVSKPNATVSKTLTHTVQVAPGTPVSIENVVGRVRITKGGPALKVTATVVAGGKDQAAAQALADSVTLRAEGGNGQPATLQVVYPLAHHDTFRYIPTQGADDTQESVQVLGFEISGGTSSSSFDYHGKRVHVVRGKAEGVPLHVDLAIEVPDGSQLTVTNHVGPVAAHGVQARLTLKTDSGDIDATGINGDLSLDTGSGDLTVRELQGALSADTGSGDIGAHDVSGNLDLETGSGDIEATQVTGNIKLETGSGDISGKTLHGDTLAMETGSGDIDVRGISGALDFSTGSGDISVASQGTVPKIEFDAGSGDILLRGNLSRVQTFEISTASGDVVLATKKPPAVHLDIDASSINVNWPDMRNVRRDETHYSGDVGSASGQGRIRTSNGDVVLK